MTKAASSIRLIAIAVVAFVAGASVAWAVVRDIADREIRSVALAHELETTGLCVNVLTLAESAESAKLSTLLQDRLDAALAHSSRLVDEGARLGVAGPNLRESTRRAAAYYERQNDHARKHDAERLLHKLVEDK